MRFVLKFHFAILESDSTFTENTKERGKDYYDEFEAYCGHIKRPDKISIDR